jgi:DNA-binding PadR family transcriptional regulator
MILCLVKWLQPVHGYDVRRELLSWNVEEWANIAPGSIYYALRQLTDEGLLEEVATEQVGTRPARTTYRVTAAGEDEFEHLLRHFWWDYRQPVDPFLAAFSLLPALPRREAAAALRNRANLLRSSNAHLRAMLDSAWINESKPVHVASMFELNVARNEAEIGWCERIARRIDEGLGIFVAELPPGTDWRSGFSPTGPRASKEPDARVELATEPRRPGRRRESQPRVK